MQATRTLLAKGGLGVSWFYKARKPPKKTIVTQYPHLKAGIMEVQQQVLGYAAPSMNNERKGTKFASKQLDGVYLEQYYTTTQSIRPASMSRSRWSSAGRSMEPPENPPST